MTSKYSLIAGATVARKEAQEIADKFEHVDSETYHKALVLRFSLEKLESDLNKIDLNTSPNHQSLADLEAKLAKIESELSEVTESKTAALTQIKTVQSECNLLKKANDTLESEVASLTEMLEQEKKASSKLLEKTAQHKVELSSKALEHERDKREIADRYKSDTLKLKERSQTLLTKEKEKNKQLQASIQLLKAENAALGRDLSKTNGQSVTDNSFKGKSKGVSFFIHEYSSPLQVIFFDSNRLSTLKGAQFHYQVMKNNGVSINVAPSTWLTPVLPDCDEFRAEWNAKIADRLHELILEQAKTNHKEEYQKVMLAKKTPITTHDRISDSEKKALQKAKLITLFDNISLTFTAFCDKMKAANKAWDDQDSLVLRAKVETIAQELIVDNLQPEAVQ